MVWFAASELNRRTRGKRRLLSATAFAQAQLFLLDSLVQVSWPTLTLEFQAFRSAREDTIFRMLRRMKSQQTDQLYQAFLEQTRAGGFADLLETYPVLGRLWGFIVDTWIETMTEFLTRLEIDLPCLRRRLGIGSNELPVLRLCPGISDRHHTGRTVVLAEFKGGRRLVYKPKGLGLECAFADLLGWLNRNESPVQFRAIEVIDRAQYGWVEFVEHTSCRSAAGVASYYRRAGALLFLIHVLEGTDCHRENIIAAGDHPVLVDAETLLHHRLLRERSTPRRNFTIVCDDYLDSVFRTGMLPSWALDSHGVPFDTSGLGGFGEQITSRPVPRWENINTDELQVQYVPGRLAPIGNVPDLDGTPQSPLDHEKELLRGFSAMYRFCQRKKALLESQDGPLHALAHHRSRFVFRDTAVYGQLRTALLQPAALTSGIAQTLHLERLAFCHLGHAARPELWPMLRSEYQSLLQYDIPYFSAMANSTDLDLADGTQITDAFEKPSFDDVLDKISATCAEDRRKQVRFIRAAFFSRSAETPHLSRARLSTRRRQPPSPAKTLSEAQFVAEAERIGGALWRDSVRVHGSAAWIGLDYHKEGRRYQYQPIGYDTYSGRCGIAIFLSGLWSVTREARWRDLALAAVNGLRDSISRSGTGATWQVVDASKAYALGRMGTLLEDDSLVRGAAKLCGSIDRRSIQSDEILDVLFGAAGALLSFLAIYRCLRSEAVLAKAIACGHRLLRRRTVTRTGHRAWSSRESPPLTGFSHGAAGIAYALLKLFEATGREEFRDAALEAIEFERAIFDRKVGNWPDFRGGKEGSAPSFMTAWCNGATGIGLSRLAVSHTIGDDIVHQEVDAAIRATRRYFAHDVDHLCCGNFGRIELLLSAGCMLQRPRLIAEARRRATVRVQNAQRNGGYRVMHRLPRWIRNPGFFQGLSGIGYQLLRLARPRELPIVLLWE
jgi:type 2 lantibiotic biosynthesis protein LanM